LILIDEFPRVLHPLQKGARHTNAMARMLPILGWLLVALDLVAAAALLLGRPSGDAATRAIGPGLGAFLAALGAVAAALMLWGGRGAGRPLVLVAACVLAAAPVALAAGLVVSPKWLLGLVYPSMRERDRPMQASPQYAFPDAATRDAALAILLNDYAKLDTLLRASSAPDLTAHDELGASLVGLAARTAVMDGGATRDLEALRLLLAAGARPRQDDTGPEETLIELVARARIEHAPIALTMLLDAGLSPDTPMHDGRSVLFHPYLSPEAARVLLARGANPNARDPGADSVDWSAVTYQASQQRWATALALLEGGVPSDHGTPPGVVLKRVIQSGDSQVTDEERASAIYKAFMAAAR